MRDSRLGWRRLKILLPVLLVLVVAAGVGQYLRPLPSVQLESDVSSRIQLPGAAPSLPWPSGGEAAVAVDGVGIIGSHGGNQAEPIGSLAKVMTALLVLRAHPLTSGETGPLVTVTAPDVAEYQQDLATGQSVVQVVVGEQLSELQLLEAMLIPSGNNIATLLATWDAGSESAFVTQMNQEASQLGLRSTRYADSSGLSAATVSDALDETRLAQVAMANAVFAQIVAMPQVTLPVVGVAYNVNADVTHGGMVGVKTGSTPQAGGCFIFAERATVAGHSVLVLGAVLGQGGTSIIDSALSAGATLANSAVAHLGAYTVVARSAVVAKLSPAWEGSIPIGSPRAVSMVGWPGLTVTLKVVAARLGSSVRKGKLVGSLQVSTPDSRVSLPLVAPTRISPPSLRWRLTRL